MSAICLIIKEHMHDNVKMHSKEKGLLAHNERRHPKMQFIFLEIVHNGHVIMLKL